MKIYEFIRQRNDSMPAEEVVKFYTQALHNNRRWLEQSIRENNKSEIKRISFFIERAEKELLHAQSRLTKREPDGGKSAKSQTLSRL